MFKPIWLIINLIVSWIILLVILYFLPAGLQRRILNIVERIVATPSEPKQELITQLESNLAKIQSKVSTDPTLKNVVSESQRIISEIKAGATK